MEKLTPSPADTPFVWKNPKFLHKKVKPSHLKNSPWR